jgi:agmatine/peptidylarginine deiminase
MHYLSAEEMKMPNNNARFFTPTDPPDHPVRMVAEYEHMQSVLVRYPFGLPTSLMAEMSQHCGVTTLVANSSQQGVVASLYQTAGANMDNIDFIIAPSDSYWTRDYGPWFVIDGNNEFGVCDFPYNRPRPNDNEVPVEVANYLGINLFGMDLEGAGGNWMCTGMSQAASTDLVWEENTQYSHAQIDELVDDYLGVSQYHVMLDPLDDYIKHIDCWGKYLSPTKVLIGQVPTNDPRYNDFEFVADYFANTISDWGVPFEVYRVYTPGNYPYTPYTNSLILNKKVFVPQTGHPNDADALAVYEDAMPGYEIYGVMFDSWVNTGALHCRTKGIADIGMLHISHMPLLGNIQLDDSYDIVANFTNYSGSPLYTDSLLVYYRIDGGAYQEIQMEQQLGNAYFAAIPYQEEGAVVEYYIHGADESGRSANHPYIGAPDPHEFTVVQMFPGLMVAPDTLLYTTVEQCVDGQVLKIYPEGEEDAVINVINQEEWDEFYWWSEPTISFPYNLPAGDSLVLTVYIGLPTENPEGFIQDTMFIDCDGGDQEVLIIVDEDLISGIGEPEGSKVISSIYPNPFEEITQLNLHVEQAQDISMEVYDIRGVMVAGIPTARLSAGEHTLTWDGSRFPSGLYHIVIRGETFTEAAKIIKR